MSAMPKEATRMVKELERDVQAEEQVLRDLERDIRRDAEILQNLERDVAELERLIPEAVTRAPTHRPRRAGRVGLAIGSGIVILAAGFGIGYAVENQTTADVRSELDQTVAALQLATDQLAEATMLLDYATFAVPFETAAAAATVDGSVRHEAMSQVEMGAGAAIAPAIPVETATAEAAADLAQRIEHAETSG